MKSIRKFLTWLLDNKNWWGIMGLMFTLIGVVEEYIKHDPMSGISALLLGLFFFAVHVLVNEIRELK